jgi:hypothetical protein
MTDQGRLVGVVVERFEIRGRGTTLVLKLPDPEVPLRRGEEVELRIPDGSARRSIAAGIETHCGPEVDWSLLGVLLSPETGSVPVGTTVRKLP